MSTMAATKQGRRPRRQFDDDFQAQAVRLVLDEGTTVGADLAHDPRVEGIVVMNQLARRDDGHYADRGG